MGVYDFGGGLPFLSLQVEGGHPFFLASARVDHHFLGMKGSKNAASIKNTTHDSLNKCIYIQNNFL